MNAVGVFLKEPKPGKVKTRLVGDGVPQELVLKLYTAFISDTLNLVQSIPADEHHVFCAPPASDPFLNQIKEKGFHVSLQLGNDFGERMAHFFELLFQKGAKRVLLIGSDSPTLPKEYLLKGLQALETKEVVLGPSQDGGYYLIGLSKMNRELFQGINWSSSEVLRQTLENLKKRELLNQVELLPHWYDIDEKADLQFLRYHLEILSSSQNGSFPSATWDVLQEVSSSNPIKLDQKL